MSCQTYQRFDRLPQQLVVMTSGDTATFEIFVTFNGAAVNLTGHDVTMSIKRSRQQIDGDELARLEIGQGLTIANAAAGRVIATLTEAQTLAFGAYTTLFYDLRIKAPDTMIYSAAEGRIAMRQAVTRTL
jgi:hypothetical protein